VNEEPDLLATGRQAGGAACQQRAAILEKDDGVDDGLDVGNAAGEMSMSTSGSKSRRMPLRMMSRAAGSTPEIGSSRR